MGFAHCGFFMPAICRSTHTDSAATVEEWHTLVSGIERLEVAEVAEMDDLTREKIREWQFRRLEIKDRMQAHPEQTLELSRVLDLMDEEHAAIIGGSTGSDVDSGETPYCAPITDQTLSRGRGEFDLQLRVAANSPEDLSRLLEIAVYELQAQIRTNGTELTHGERIYPGSMSGTLGDYDFEFRVSDEVNCE